MNLVFAVLSTLPTRPLAARVLRAPHPRLLCTSSKSKRTLHVAGLAYDLETTGVGPGAEIIQLAVHTCNSAKDEPPVFAAYVLPRGPIDPGATRVHGLTMEKLEAAGAAPFDEVWAQCEAWIDETFGGERPLVWCAHNGNSFDHPILRRECIRIGRNLADDERHRFEDTLPLSRRILPGRRGPDSYSLRRLYADATAGGGFANAHDALADAQALSTVWRWLAATLLPAEADDAARAAAFQSELQRIGYAAPPGPATVAPAPAAARKSSPKRAAGAATKSKRAPQSSSEPPLLGMTPALELPGVGPATAKRLAKRGVATADDLLRAASEAYPGSDAQKAVQAFCTKDLHGILHPANRARLTRWCGRYALAREAPGD